MRIAVVMLVATLLFPSGAAFFARSMADCCCPGREGASCPMRHSPHPCGKNGAMSCGVRDAVPFAALLPAFGDQQQPALLPDAIATLSAPNVALFAMPTATLVRSASSPPEPPPPKQA